MTIPTKVNRCLKSKKVVFVAANNNHSACITEDGDTYTWGKGKQCRLGHGNQASRYTPKLVDGSLVGKKAKEVACGGRHTIVVTEDGMVYSFGDGKEGQLGHCDVENNLFPTMIKAPLEGKCVVQVACGQEHSMALTPEGRIYTWGDGEEGILGRGSELNYCMPSVVESLIGYKVAHITSGGYHSVVLVDSKQSYAMKMKSIVNNEICSDVVFVLNDDECVHANKGLLIGQSE
jgi:RCC1 and BTB domain-containing protein